MFIGLTADVPINTNTISGGGIKFLPPDNERTDMVKRATGNGFYTQGEGQFLIRKDDVLPDSYDDIFYDEENEGQDETVDSDTFRAGKLASETATDAEGENASDDGGVNNENASDGANPPVDLAAEAEVAPDTASKGPAKKAK